VSAAPCPDDDALVALVEHALAPAALADLEGHVDRCARCRATVGHLAALDDGADPRPVGRYRLDHLLGAGGMGVVWRAWDPMLERAVAIKLLRADGGADGAARLLREARALAQLAHPNVIAVHDVGEHDGEVFVATELVEGEPMHRWQHGRDSGEIVAAYAQAARGLAAAHALGLVHRDVKPANILVGTDGRVRVGDFGLVARTVPGTGEDGRAPAFAPAAAADLDALTETDAIVGTPAYMAPEQRAGLIATARSDQYSLCLALAEALVGARPPPDTSAQALARGVAADAPWPAIARGLARDPAARFRDMAALANALEAGGPARAAQRRRRRWTAAAAGVAIALAGAIGAWAALGGTSGPRAPAARPPSARAVGEAIRASRAAAERHDPAACLAAADRLAALGDAVAPSAALERGICEMVAGRCEAGRARISRALGDAGAPPDASIYVKTWCPIEGDLPTRLDRAWTQAAAHADPAYCRAIEAPVLAVADEVARADHGRYDTDATLARMRAGDAVSNLGRCYALAHRCDDATRLWTRATAVRGIELGHIPCT
jgi:eukaryotic-like serine/threonine-protein kinase